MQWKDLVEAEMTKEYSEYRNRAKFLKQKVKSETKEIMTQGKAKNKIYNLASSAHNCWLHNRHSHFKGLGIAKEAQERGLSTHEHLEKSS